MTTVTSGSWISSRDDEWGGAPSLGRYYEDAEKELGPEAPHFDVVKRAGPLGA